MDRMLNGAGELGGKSEEMHMASENEEKNAG